MRVFLGIQRLSARWISVFACFLIVTGFTWPADGQEKDRTQNEPTVAQSAAEIEKNIIRYTNAYRRKRGIVPLEKSPALGKLARIHNEHMRERAQRFEQPFERVEDLIPHESQNFPEGWRTFRSRMDKAELSSAAENTAVQTYRGDPERWAREIVEGWMKSPGHRKNILDSKYRYIGVGVTPGIHDLGFATQVFSSNRGKTP